MPTRKAQSTRRKAEFEKGQVKILSCSSTSMSFHLHCPQHFLDAQNVYVEKRKGLAAAGLSTTHVIVALGFYHVVCVGISSKMMQLYCGMCWLVLCSRYMPNAAYEFRGTLGIALC